MILPSPTHTQHRMTESENTESSREPSIHHMKMATLKDWLLNIEHEYINMDVDSDSSQQQQQQQQNILSDFEFYKEDERKHSTASSADELFLEGKLLPLETVQKHHHNNNAAATAAASATAAIDHVRSQFSIEESTIPRSTDNADSNNVISPPHSRRFSSSDANISEYRFNEFPADLTKRSWSLRRKQNKQSWLVQKLKASRAYIKSLFSNSASSEKDKSCRCSDSTAGNNNNNVGGSAGKNKPEPNVEHDAAVDGDARKGSFENMDDDSAAANTFSKSLHDDIAGGSSRRMSFSGVLKRHFSSSRGSNLMMMTSGAAAVAATAGNSSGSSSNSSSFSLGCKELKALKESVSAAAHHQQQHHDVEKSVEGAIAHCKLSQHKASELKIAPKVAASGNQDVAPPANNTQG